MDIQVVRQEIALPAYAGLTPTEIAAKLNAVEVVVQEAIPIQQLLLWAASTQALRRLRALVTSGTEPLASVAEIALQLIGLGLPFDPQSAEVGSMLASFVDGQVFTADEVANLVARGQRTISRAEQLGLSRVYEQNVVDAQSL